MSDEPSAPGTAITSKQIWAALTPVEKEDACLAFWQGTDALSREAQPRVLRDLATALHFREMFLKRTRNEDKASHLRRLIDTPTLRHYHDDVLRSWLLVRKTPLLVCFVEAQGMPHDGGVIRDEAPQPNAETLRKGVRALREQFPLRDVALYMAVMIAAGGDFWAGLPEVVAAEIPDLSTALIVPKV